jgi:hypothetical protein
MRGFPKFFMKSLDTGQAISVSEKIIRFDEREVVFILPDLPLGMYQVYFDSSVGRSNLFEFEVTSLAKKLGSLTVPQSLVGVL